MPWVSRDAFLARWLPQFHDQQLCIQEADKYLRGAHVPDDGRGDKWMQKALDKDIALAAIGDPEDYVTGPSRYDTNGCYHCAGRGFVRLEVEPMHADFGKAKPCPACHGRAGDESNHCATCFDVSANPLPASERNRCSVCRQCEDEPAAENCRTPKWHLPNWKGIPATPPGVRRDYVAELAKHMQSDVA